MWEFYKDIARRLPHLFWQSLRVGEGELAAVAFLVWLYDNTLGGKVMAWIGLHPAWALLPVGLVFGHLVMKAVYQKFCVLEDEKNGEILDLNSHIDTLRQDILRIGQQSERAVKDLDHTWHQRYVEVSSENDTLKNRIKDLENQINDRDRKRLIAGVLSSSIQAGGILLSQSITSEDEYASFKMQSQQWYANTTQQIRNAMSEADAIVFQHIGARGAIGFNGSFNPEHNGMRNNINALVENLRNLYQSYST